MKRYWEPLKQFLKFNVVGILNTVIDLLVFGLFNSVFGFGDALSKTVSYSCGVLNSYLWNSRWTFKQEQKRTKKEFLLFVLVNLVSYGASLGILYACRAWFGIENGTMRNLIATPVAVVINFIGNKLLVFRKEQKAQ